ncbi:Valyl-tRNA synthetase [Helicobacter bizzozeronii CCUG 35545]|nr:Valyl-tRNA synthetase [Helicobacter bizzozeronii CCUG 35545]
MAKNLSEVGGDLAHTPSTPTTMLGRYAQSRLNATTKEVRNALEQYRFNDVATLLYRFLWGEFCDWFVEFSKGYKQSSDAPLVFGELVSILKQGLQLLHPLMPYSTEYLYQTLSGTSLEQSPSIMLSAYPKDTQQDWQLEACFDAIKEAIIALRRIKILLNTPIAQAFVQSKIPLEPQALHLIAKLSKIASVQMVDQKPAQSLSDVGELVSVHVDLSGIDVSALIKRLQAQLDKLAKEKAKLNLDNPHFFSQSP